MRQRFRLFYLLLASALVGLVAASCTSSGVSNPEYRFQEGDVARYSYQTTQKGQVTIDGDTEDFELYMANTISQKTQKVDDEGVATIDATYEDTKLTVDGEDLPLPDFLSILVTYEIDANGVIKNVRGTNGIAGPLGERQFDPGQMFQFQGPVFREGALKKGDKWQQTVAVTMPGADQIDASITYTYEGKERVKAKDAAKVSFIFDAPLDVAYTELDTLVKVVGSEQIEGIAFFSLEEGRTVKATGKGPLKLSLRTPSEGGGDDLERVKVEIDVDFNYELID